MLTQRLPGVYAAASDSYWAIVYDSYFLIQVYMYSIARTNQWTLERCNTASRRVRQTDPRLPVTRGSWRSCEGYVKVMWRQHERNVEVKRGLEVSMKLVVCQWHEDRGGHVKVTPRSCTGRMPCKGRMRNIECENYYQGHVKVERSYKDHWVI